MCGIVAYTGWRHATPIILDGLSRLEYRGYDSAGLALTSDGQIGVRRAAGKLSQLRRIVQQEPIAGRCGIGHTRWATHGLPSITNAHPHCSSDGCFAIVHNGIVENHHELRQQLQRQGVVLRSETDSEVIVHWVQYIAARQHLNLTEAATQVASMLHGSQAIVLMRIHEPHTLVAVRLGNAGGLAIGVGSGEVFVASDTLALIGRTRQIAFLESHQVATITPDTISIHDLQANNVQLQLQTLHADPMTSSRGAYPHYMAKEIQEQPQAIAATLRDRIDNGACRVDLAQMSLDPSLLQRVKRIATVACGTSYLSGLVGQTIIETISHIPVTVDYASEYRYRPALDAADAAVLAITQSGETADTLAAMEAAQHRGALLWSIVNSAGSQAVRISDGFITMNAGAEIGVASTKAFTCSVVDQYLLALALAQSRNTLTADEMAAHIDALTGLPALIERVLLSVDKAVQRLATCLVSAEHALFLGRGILYPVAMEGALKLKEISYIHAEGYPAGEMKHGPIALIDEKMPVIALAPHSALYEKMLSQVEQVRARRGMIAAIVSHDDTVVAERADHIIRLPAIEVAPQASPFVTAIVSVLPLQLLAYYTAVMRGLDVDQPRNLAKSVTVE